MQQCLASSFVAKPLVAAKPVQRRAKAAFQVRPISVSGRLERSGGTGARGAAAWLSCGGQRFKFRQPCWAGKWPAETGELGRVWAAGWQGCRLWVVWLPMAARRSAAGQPRWPGAAISEQSSLVSAGALHKGMQRGER